MAKSTVSIDLQLGRIEEPPGMEQIIVTNRGEIIYRVAIINEEGDDAIAEKYRHAFEIIDKFPDVAFSLYNMRGSRDAREFADEAMRRICDS